jgi:hypothetical protein
VQEQTPRGFNQSTNTNLKASNQPKKPQFKVLKMAPLLNNFSKPSNIKKLTLLSKKLSKMEESDEEANADISAESMVISESSSLGDGQKSDAGVESITESEVESKDLNDTMDRLRHSPIAELMPRPDRVMQSGRLVVVNSNHSRKPSS